MQRTRDGIRSTIDVLMNDLTEEPTIRAILDRVRELVPEAEHVSLGVLAGRRLRTLAATSALAERSESLQSETGEGPSRETGESWARSGDVGGDSRWPSWGPKVADLGLRSLLSLPMVTGVGRLGTLNLYSSAKGAFTDNDALSRVPGYANHAANALRSAQHISGLEAALQSRQLIGMAVGILMQRYELHEDAAFAVLKRTSNHLNRKLRDVAAHVIAARELPT